MMLTLRELIVEYILFAISDEELMEKYHLTDAEVYDLADPDLLEIYDQILLTPINT